MSYLVLTYDPSKYLIRVFFMIDMNRACTTLDCKVWVRGPNPLTLNMMWVWLKIAWEQTCLVKYMTASHTVLF